jgi:hypothetical protein
MSQKWRFDPKWLIKIRFFNITLRVSNLFSIFFLHSVGVTKTQILWKKFFKNSKMAAGLKKPFEPPSWIFWKKFHKICVLVTPNYCKKKPAFWKSDAILNLTKNFSSVKYGRLKPNFQLHSIYFANIEFLEHIFKKWALLKSLCRPSVRLSVCLSVRYFSAGIAPRELKFCT